MFVCLLWIFVMWWWWSGALAFRVTPAAPDVESMGRAPVGDDEISVAEICLDEATVPGAIDPDYEEDEIPGEAPPVNEEDYHANNRMSIDNRERGALYSTNQLEFSL